MIAVSQLRRMLLGAAGAATITLVGAAPALAASSWWHLSQAATPASLPVGEGKLAVIATNLGNAPVGNGVTITDKLPAGLHATAIETRGPSFDRAEKGKCVLATLTCQLESPPSAEGGFELTISVDVESSARTGEVNEAVISGGGVPAATLRRPISVGAAPAFGVENYEVGAEEEGGKPDTQAGSHPFQLTTTIAFNRGADAEHPPALVKDMHFRLPSGLIGNPVPFPQCPDSEFLHSEEFINFCPPETALGTNRVTIFSSFFGGFNTYTVPVFNLEPRYGEPARFGFMVLGVPVFLDTSLRTGEDYGVTVEVDNVNQAVTFSSSELTFWGVPGDPRHNSGRGWACVAGEFWAESVEDLGLERCKPEEEHNPPPFLTLPTSCDGPLQTSVGVDSWKEPGAFADFPSSVPMEAQDGCNRLPFAPSVKVTPDGQAGSTPTGLTVDEHVSQASSLDPTGLGESDVKGLSVTLPEGVALNPAGADGLQACSEEQIGMQSADPPTCPEAAKIATAKIRTPLLNEPLEGAAYLATQDANPFGSLVAMYVYAENAAEGVRAKAVGEVVENPVTGQITAHFEGDPLFEDDPAYAGDEAAQFLPEVPFEDIELHFFGGDRAPLTTPAKCGAYTTSGTFAPWSGNAASESSSTFDVVSGPNGSPCENPLLFKPTLTTGTSSIQAGGFSPFVMTMSREDGEQSLQSVKLRMPPGMLGTLSTVKLCGEPQADEGTCGPESQIGETIVSVGVGGDPYSVRGGKVYITGPYKGAPYGLSIVNPAVAGPFNLGKVIVRAKVEVDPETAQLTIATDESGPYKIPTILDGIPLEIKHVNVNINRPNFAFNPTNCSPLAVTGTLQSSEGSSASLSIPFQITNCAVLAFKPKLEASTSGKTSRANGASLHVRLSYPAGPYDANISRVKVELPKQMPSRLTTLQKACTAEVFNANPAGCPAASVVGHATATTPVLPVPLEGPAYFVSHGNEAFPSLIIVLQGYGVTVHLVGTTFISGKGITSSTFKTVPDVPVGTFELTLPQGPYSALTSNTSLCKAKSLAMPTEFLGQNGALIKTTTKITTSGCPKAKKKRKKKTTHRGAKKKPSAKRSRGRRGAARRGAHRG